jgi:hypothetical protein
MVTEEKAKHLTDDLRCLDSLALARDDRWTLALARDDGRRKMKALLSSGDPKVTSARVRASAHREPPRTRSSLSMPFSVSYATTEPREWPTTTISSYSHPVSCSSRAP